MKSMRIWSGIFCMVLALCLVPAGRMGLRADQEKPPLKIGVCLALADPAGEGGRQRNALMIAQRVRPLTADGRRVQLVIKDSQGASGGVREAMVAILGEGDLGGIIGGATTEEAAAMLEVVVKDKRRQRSHLPVVVTTATGPLEAPPGAVWRMCTPLNAQAQAAAGFTLKSLKAKRAGIILDPSDRDNVRLASLFSAAFIARGGIVADIAYINRGDSDYSAPIAMMAKKRPDMIFLPYAAATSSLITYARTHGLKTPFLITNVFHTWGFIKTLRSAKDVYLLTDFYPEAATSETARRFRDEFRKAYGEVDASDALAADAYFLLTDTVACSDGKGRFHLRQLIAAFQGHGYLSGDVSIGKEELVVRNMYGCMVQGSRLKYLDTFRP